jgi:hypothetical protein
MCISKGKCEKMKNNYGVLHNIAAINELIGVKFYGNILQLMCTFLILATIISTIKCATRIWAMDGSNEFFDEQLYLAVILRLQTLASAKLCPEDQRIFRSGSVAPSLPVGQSNAQSGRAVWSRTKFETMVESLYGETNGLSIL